MIEMRLVVHVEPVFFDGHLEDIYSKDGIILMHFISRGLSTDFEWELECDRAIVNEILSHSDENSSRYAVVAKIKDVTKSVASLVGSVSTFDEVLSIEPIDKFTAYGSCVEIVSLSQTP